MAYMKLFENYYKTALLDKDKKDILANELLCDLAFRAWSSEREERKLSGAHLLILQKKDVKNQLNLPFKEAVMDHLSIKKISDQNKKLIIDAKSQSKSLLVYVEKDYFRNTDIKNEVIPIIEKCKHDSFVIVVCFMLTGDMYYKTKTLPIDVNLMFSDLKDKVPDEEYTRGMSYFDINQSKNLVIDFMIHHCGFCGSREKKLNRCSRCKITKYCNKDCQKNHYNTHKINCNEQINL